MEVEDQDYGIDEALITQLAWALAHNDKDRAQECLDEIQERINGVCFCAAHSDSECVCGAWDGIWGPYDDES